MLRSLLLSLLLVSAISATETVLSINNSLIGYNNQVDMLNQMAAAAGKDMRWTAHSDYGKSLQDQYDRGEGSAVRTKIKGTAWTHIILQEFSSTPLQNPNAFRDSVLLWRDYIRSNCPNPNARIILFHNWPFNDATNYVGETAQISTNTSAIAEIAGVDAWIHPTGRAYNVIRQTDGNAAMLALYTDNRHPTVLASYLSACVGYAMFYRQSPVGLTWKPSSVSQADATRMQTRAWTAAGSAAPTVHTSARATVTGMTAALSALGSDDGGRTNLFYTWSVDGSAPGTVTFSTNASHAAASTTATFSAPGTYHLRVTIADCGQLSVNSTVSVTITSSPVAPVVTSGQSASGTVGTVFSYQVLASNAPTTFTATGLPAGLTMATSGLITGTPTTAGSFTPSITASNSAGQDTKTITIAIASSAVAPVVTANQSTTGTVGAAFSYQVLASNAPTGFTATGLPGGLTISNSGLITGTPTAAGTFTPSVTASNAGGSGTGTIAITIASSSGAPVVTANQSVSGTVGSGFSYRVQASNAPTGFTATGLPAGLSMSRSGNITGTPTAAGTFTPSITATNAAGSGTGTITIIITQSAVAPVVTANQSASGTFGVAFSYQVQASNTPTTVTATDLPAGLTISNSGLITGTPTAAGSFTPSITAANSAGSDTKSITITIANAGGAGTLAFAANKVSVGESAGTCTLSVSRGSGSAGAVSVNWATNATGATATAGSDYTAASGTLNWADGDTAAKTISIPVLSDTTVEPSEVFRVVLSAPAGGAQLGSASTAYVTILDDDAAALYTPWSSQDLGSVLATGSASQSGDLITLAGSGADVWGNADACRFAALTITGDFDLVARVDSQTRTHSWAKAGLMVRASTAAGAMHASCFVTPSNGSVLQWRAATNGSSASLAGPNVAAPTWLKLSRRSTTVTGYQSADGTAWTLIGSKTVALPSAALVGVAVTSHADGLLSVAQFSEVLLTPMASN